MEFILQITCIILLIPAMIAGTYYLFLAVCALSQKKAKQKVSTNSTNTFAIVIPAHNEEKTIARTVSSCKGLDYPKDKFEIFVIADNCSDRTALIAGEAGATCFERYDEKNRGKGYALAWAFQQILPRSFDVLVVMDADCVIDSHALTVFDGYLSEGYDVLQANDVAANPEDSSISYAVAVGNFIENELIYAPKSQLGLAVFLRGTGMVIKRTILEKLPWDAYSIAEDMEYSTRLMKNNIRIGFVREARVMSEFPMNSEQLDVQRTRWAGGNLGFGKFSEACKLICEGIFKKRIILIDAGLTMLLLSRPLILLFLTIALIISIICFWLFPGILTKLLLATSMLTVIAMGLYFALGIILMGINYRRMQLLFAVPFVVIRLAFVSILGIIGVDKNIWARTPR